MMNVLNNFQPNLRSSGDLIADRRYDFAVGYAAAGDFQAAAELLEQVIERTPSWPAAWAALAQAREALGQNEAAVHAFARAAALDAKDELGASLHLARLGAAAAPDTAPERYIESLFDQYAGRFEAHLVDTLSYRGPAQLAAAVGQQHSGRFAHVVDLGCGTGLCGAAFRAKADFLAGVDLSPLMIAQARAKGLYDQLYVQNLSAFLDAAAAASADLLLAADVLMYVGDLDPLLRGARRVLRPSGLFAFTLQKAQASSEVSCDGFQIGADLRYAHQPAYVRALAQRQEFVVASMEETSTRREAGIDVPGLITILETC
ncbi:MAG: methyltransferase domain-containing protein [Methylovirgula sp.]